MDGRPLPPTDSWISLANLARKSWFQLALTFVPFIAIMSIICMAPPSTDLNITVDR
ncbi:conserved Plasmodium protein, unknown function [Babesia microti strain RI]|uniref:Uncharacterized protein n=1 Tax=Babesia microti (strain RI) TaxID=1133968 RepID=A0A1N6LYI2_BABMR|nr:conserved Plasmodium protein, unknown function [Babesia microti strain RI]SIO73927.1 conserved Plasmodium protein, unknown function [Babesia microti strain RI]|eukprot:XP_021337974.1 conserved Plasmodium protein, unknown function [Babesia microti strain RI]